MTEKCFASIVEMDQLYSKLLENVVVAETRDFVQAFALLLVFYVFNVSQENIQLGFSFLNMFPSSALITIPPENVKNFKFFNVFRGNIN